MNQKSGDVLKSSAKDPKKSAAPAAAAVPKLAAAVTAVVPLHALPSDPLDASALKYGALHYLNYADRLRHGFVDGGRGFTASLRVAVTSSTPTIASLSAVVAPMPSAGKPLPIGGDREVLYLSRHDSALQDCVRRARELLWSHSDLVTRIQLLALFVSVELGGGLKRIVGITTDHIRQLQVTRNSRCLPLGSLIGCAAGVCRHRSVLFKFLADDSVLNAAQWCDPRLATYPPPIECRLIRGNQFGGGHAWNVVRIPAGGGNKGWNHFVVDVMQQPWRLLPEGSPDANGYARGMFADGTIGAASLVTSTQTCPLITRPLLLNLQSTPLPGASSVFRATYSGAPVAVKRLPALDEAAFKASVVEARHLAHLYHPHLLCPLAICKSPPSFVFEWINAAVTLEQHIAQLNAAAMVACASTPSVCPKGAGSAGSNASVNPAAGGIASPAIASSFGADSKTASTTALDGYDLMSAAGKLHVLVQIATALQALHSVEPPATHGNLCPANVLLTSNGVVKLCGLRYWSNTYSSANDADLPYCSPALLLSSSAAATDRDDIYSFGAVAYRVWFLSDPWGAAASPAHIRAAVAKSEPPPLLRLNCLSEHDKLAVLIRECLSSAAEQRPRAFELVRRLYDLRDDAACRG